MAGIFLGFGSTVRSGGGAGFDPVDLFGGGETGFVFDLSDSSTVFQEIDSTTTPSGNGDPIGTLVDLSPNGNDINAAADASRPTYGISGSQAWSLFNSSNSEYLAATFTLSQTITYVVSFRLITYVDFRFLMDGSSLGSVFFTMPGSNVIRFGASAQIGADTISNGEDFVMTARASGGTSRVAKNSGSYTTGNTGTTNAGGITFGSAAGGVAPADIRLYRAIGIGRDLTDSEVANARQWCADAAGVSL